MYYVTQDVAYKYWTFFSDFCLKIEWKEIRKCFIFPLCFPPKVQHVFPHVKKMQHQTQKNAFPPCNKIIFFDTSFCSIGNGFPKSSSLLFFLSCVCGRTRDGDCLWRERVHHTTKNESMIYRKNWSVRIKIVLQKMLRLINRLNLTVAEVQSRQAWIHKR